MAIKTFNQFSVEVDGEGFMNDFKQWNKEIGEAISKEEGIVALTPSHWKVIEYMQKEFLNKGTAPSIRNMNKSGIISTKELYELFPGGPAKKAAKIAGLKKPVGCV